MTARPEARISWARATALSSSGRVLARAEFFSEEMCVAPAPLSESSWVSRDWRRVEARA